MVAYLGNEYHATLLLMATLLAVMVRPVGRAQISEALASISGHLLRRLLRGLAALATPSCCATSMLKAAQSKYGAAAVAELGISARLRDLPADLLPHVAVVLTDTGAYFAGNAWGKRKLARRGSAPGKTVEGAVGGVVGGTAGSLTAKGPSSTSSGPSSPVPLLGRRVPVMGLVVSGLAVVGDLVESLLKRDAQTKDAGSLLPGMGGILDRIDSPLLGIPGMYYMLLFYVYMQEFDGTR